MLCRSGVHRTKLAVPYPACDTPSEKSEFKDADKAILLSHLSYYKSGLAIQDMKDALQALKPIPGVEESVLKATYAYLSLLITLHDHLVSSPCLHLPSPPVFCAVNDNRSKSLEVHHAE